MLCAGAKNSGMQDQTRERERAEQTSKPPLGTLVQTPAELARLCEGVRASEALGLDTEFVRTRTFYPKLGLVQVADRESCHLIDALACEPWDSLVELLVDPRVVKVLHSASEDLEVLLRCFGALPTPLFDSQIAATLCGYGYSPGYQRLVQEMFGLELPKGETRSNWLARPLSKSQLEYAALDVAYLVPIRERLVAQLEAKQRLHWAAEEFERLAELARARLDPAWGYERIKKGKLTTRQRGVLRALSDWREEAARERDLPRSFVVADDVLVQLARSRPRTVDELRTIKGLRPAERRRSSTELLRRIRQGLEMEVTEEGAELLHAGHSRGTVDALKQIVAALASELDLPSEFLAQRRLLSELVARYRAGVSEPLPVELRGWRRAVVGGPLLAALPGLE